MAITQILLITSVGILGIFLGAQICEGALFVPYWKSLAPKAFFDLHQTYGKKIHRFFAPLTIAATFVPVFTAGYHLLVATACALATLGMAVCCLLFFATYFLYFKKANRGFADQRITAQALPQELRRWGHWHWGRVILESIAFGFGLAALAS